MQIYIVKVHKVIFPLGSDVGFMSLGDHLLSVNSVLSVDTVLSYY